MGKKNIVIGAIVLLMFFITEAQANLIINGDFEAGNTDFTSDYSSNDLFSSGQQYVITTDPHLNISVATSYGDNSACSGNMMAVNGAATANQVVWAQDVTLEANTDYLFSIFISSWTPTNLANLEFSLNNGDVSLGSVLAPATPGVWVEHKVKFNSGTLFGLTNISFIDTTSTWGGDDFAIDDISLIAIPDDICDDCDTPLSICEGDLASSQLDLAQALEGLDQANLTILDQEAQIASLADQLVDLNTYIATLEAQVVAGDQIIADRDADIAALEAERDGLIANLAVLQAQMDSLNATLNVFQAVLADVSGVPVFAIPGNTPADQIQNLINVISNMNQGKLMDLIDDLENM